MNREVDQMVLRLRDAANAGRIDQDGRRQLTDSLSLAAGLGENSKGWGSGRRRRRRRRRRRPCLMVPACATTVHCTLDRPPPTRAFRQAKPALERWRDER